MTDPSPISFRPFAPGDETAFRELNEAWISRHFAVEEKDRALLNDPQTYILGPGGTLLMATEDGVAIGTCALLAMGDDSFEVAKMTVSESHRGLGLGKRLLAYVIDYARELGAKRLYLETNSSLRNAIHVYESLGFTHLPPERIKPSPYARADTYMELWLH